MPETINLPDGLLVDLLETAAEAINESTTTDTHQVPAVMVDWLKTVIATHPDAQVRDPSQINRGIRRFMENQKKPIGSFGSELLQ